MLINIKISLIKLNEPGKLKLNNNNQNNINRNIELKLINISINLIINNIIIIPINKNNEIELKP